ncbi:putative MFS family arabinose efflux permease [Rhodococcus rhodochrous J38]|uniref:MFS transporter n=1 Tax=Rhodococcus rhodochrous TaxID=1829 RepID=UPI0011A39C2F|nr:MFS transporter [Rhodococcus rhodochrous]TWH44402.1 putative MFS family arabinose efflux permease [Rhodococcus rhodochrous J38]
MTHTSTGRPKASSSGIFITVLVFMGIVASALQTLLVPVLDDLPLLLNTEPDDAAWTITATLLSGAVATPIMGRLGDLYGKRRLLILSLALMVAGAFVSALTSVLLTMVIGRALQGFAMSAIPLGISLMRDMLPHEKHRPAMAIMSSTMGVGSSLGLPIAALVVQHADWHILFYGCAGLGVICIGLILWAVPESPVRTQGTFDLLGAIGLSAGLVLFLLPISMGSEWGWTSGTTLGLFAAAAVVLILWGALELSIEAPLVNLRSTARPPVLFTNLASIAVGSSFLVVSLVLPRLLQLPTATGYGLGQSMVTAALLMAPLGLTTVLVAPVYARLSARYSPKVTLISGMVIIAVGYIGGLGLMSAAWQSLVITIVLGVGIGLAYSSLPALIVDAAPAAQTASANGLNTLMRSLGSSVAGALVGMVLANTAQSINGVTVPTLHGFRMSFLIAASAMAIGLLMALFLPRIRVAEDSKKGPPRRPMQTRKHAADGKSPCMMLRPNSSGEHHRTVGLDPWGHRGRVRSCATGTGPQAINHVQGTRPESSRSACITTPTARPAVTKCSSST